MQYSTEQHSAVQYSTLQHSTVHTRDTVELCVDAEDKGAISLSLPHRLEDLMPWSFSGQEWTERAGLGWQVIAKYI